jgi:hypothetical protein
MIIFLLLFLISCSSNQLSMKPIDAGILEMPFHYLKDGKYVQAFGHEAASFSSGDKKVFRFKVHKRTGECQFNYNDGEDHFTKDCSQEKEIVLDLGEYNNQTPSAIRFSIASEKLGIQTGRFYPTIKRKLTSLPVRFKCPYQKTNKDVSICTRPASFDFRIKVIIEQDQKGELLYTYKCNNSAMVSEKLAIDGKGSVSLSMVSMKKDYCKIGMALKQDRDKFRHTINVKFYNPKYIPLPTPIIKKVSSGYKICAPESYKAYTVNGLERGKWYHSKCKKIGAENVEVFVWDNLGRFSWRVLNKRPPI